jgi:hypothetical protein
MSCGAPAEQMALSFFSDLPQKVVVRRMAVLRHLCHTVEIKGAPFLVLIYFPIFGQRSLQQNKGEVDAKHAET